MRPQLSRTGAWVRTLTAAAIAACGAPLAAQDADPSKLAEELLKEPLRAISADEGQKLLDRLREMGEPTQLTVEASADFLVCRIVALLATGQAADAQAAFPRLKELQPDQPRTARVAHLVACAAGDARLGADALNELGKPGDEAARRELASQARRFHLVGSSAPAETVSTSAGTQIGLADRGGKPLVIYLWNLRKKPSGEQIAAMRKTFETYRDDPQVEFLGVSANSGKQADEAAKFARSNNLTWPHHFEESAAGAPITHKALKAGSDPAQIVIDGDGLVRAIGEIGEPGVEYALRCVIAEAAGHAQPPESHAADGRAAQRGAAGEKARRGGDERADKAKPERPAQLRSDPEAENLLKQARLFFRTGNKTKAKELLQRIVSEYPDTTQAKEAKSMLDNMP